MTNICDVVRLIFSSELNEYPLLYPDLYFYVFTCI